MTDDALKERIRRIAQEPIVVAPYDPRWPEWFRLEKAHLRWCLPADLIGRIEHIVDMLVEAADLEATKTRIVPVLDLQGYDYIWRPTSGDDVPPFYAWFIKRDRTTGARTHHIHMVEADFPQWDALLFRDYLVDHPDVAREYEALKIRLAAAHPNDRDAYTRGKTAFVSRVTEHAKRESYALLTAPHVLLESGEFTEVMRQRGGRPMLLIDLAVPRDIDAACAGIDGVSRPSGTTRTCAATPQRSIACGPRI